MVQSDETLFSIVESLRRLDGAGVTELAEELGMAKSAVHKHLKTLAHHGYVSKRSGAYHLGFEFLVLGGHVRHADELSRLVGPRVDELAAELDRVAMFSVEENGRGIIVHQANQLSIDIHTHIGTPYDLHLLAPGKAMLARLSDERIREIAAETGLPAVTDRTIDSVERLVAEIESVREHGFATSVEEGTEGEATVAVALEHPENGTLGALSITGPVTTSVERTLETEYAERLFEVASEVRYQLSG